MLPLGKCLICGQDVPSNETYWLTPDNCKHLSCVQAQSDQILRDVMSTFNENGPVIAASYPAGPTEETPVQENSVAQAPPLPDFKCEICGGVIPGDSACWVGHFNGVTIRKCKKCFDIPCEYEGAEKMESYRRTESARLILEAEAKRKAKATRAWRKAERELRLREKEKRNPAPRKPVMARRMDDLPVYCL